MWDTRTQQIAQTLPTEGTVLSLEAPQDGSSLFTAAHGNTVSFWDGNNFDKVSALPGSTNPAQPGQQHIAHCVPALLGQHQSCTGGATLLLPVLPMGDSTNSAQESHLALPTQGYPCHTLKAKELEWPTLAAKGSERPVSVHCLAAGHVPHTFR